MPTRPHHFRRAFNSPPAGKPERGVLGETRDGIRLASQPVGRHRSNTFQSGDSNRCRTVYEQILRAHTCRENEFDAQKLNKHVSVGRCRMLAM